jgi:rhamnose utilization protein RhaD (predicted bifunctional aldolase and dehydrogenase)
VRLAHLQRLARLSDPQMINELATQMTRASAPAPSVEAIARESYRELSLRFPSA